MQKKYIFSKKLYISILTTILVLLTTVATTFAWVGVFANSTFDAFEIKIKGSQLVEYGIEISATGEEGTFSDTIDDILIKKQILKNYGISPSSLTKTNSNGEIIDNEEMINYYFSTIKLEQCTMIPILQNGKIQQFDDFRILENNEITKKYFKYDIFISAKKNYNTESSSTFLLDVFLDTNMLSGTTKERTLFNSFTYPTSFINPNILNSETSLRNVSGGENISYARVNSKSAVRVGFEKYEVVDKYHPEQYTNTSTPKSGVIFTGDSYDYPTYDENTGIYEFGSILPDEINLSTEYWNSTEYQYAHGNYRSMSLPDEIKYTRSVVSETKDLVLNKETNQLISSKNEDEQISIGKMMKITVYFWFEGWDADCFNIINRAPVTMNLTLNMSNEDDE